MMRNAVTASYLDEMDRRGVGAGELPAIGRDSAELKPTTYAGRCLSRPLFLDAAERSRLEQDLDNLHGALAALPGRLFGGDLGAFARAAGMTEPQVTAILRARSSTPARLSRADMRHDGEGFRIMELNMGSTVGGLDNAVLNRIMLGHPAVAEFADGHGLSYLDTMAELAGMLRDSFRRPDGGAPLFAAADWPKSFERLEPQLRNSARTLGRLGVEIEPCHLGQLEVRDGGVWLHGRRVDVLYRVFLIEDLLEPEAAELIDPVLRAVERGEVDIFTPIDVELYGSKATLAMLSDEANRHLLDPGERDSLDRLLPWTRMVREGPVTVDGQRVDLVDYAVERQQDLVLKPRMLHGGRGVVLGWGVDADEWRQRLRAAHETPYVLQRRLRSASEPFPAADGREELLISWGIFTVGSGYGGAFARGSADLDGGQLNSAADRTLTCCFHQT